MKPDFGAVQFGNAYSIVNIGGATSKQKAQAIRQLTAQADVDSLAQLEQILTCLPYELETDTCNYLAGNNTAIIDPSRREVAA